VIGRADTGAADWGSGGATGCCALDSGPAGNGAGGAGAGGTPVAGSGDVEGSRAARSGAAFRSALAGAVIGPAGAAVPDDADAGGALTPRPTKAGRAPGRVGAAAGATIDTTNQRPRNPVARAATP
jgi:hypothetical protein